MSESVSSPIKDALQQATVAAMRQQDKPRLAILRFISAALKQREVDARCVLSDADIIEILSTLAKQRREAITQFSAAQRQDLVDKERAELAVIDEFLPEPLSESAIEACIEEACVALSATSVREMGAVMAQLKPQLVGRADMAQVSAKVKQRLLHV